MSEQPPLEPARGRVTAKPGDCFGNYTIVELYATGGMAEVYLATDNLDRKVALKFPSADKRGVDEWLEREAKILARFDHENVVGIYGFDRTENGAVYIAMPFLTGRTLEDTFDKGRSLSIKQRIDVILQVLNGLQYSHANDVIHRDIKPSNIFLLDDGRVKIFDFGIARRVESTATWPAMIIGTPAYMSPEQVEAKRLDSRSDLFSVGSVLYELLVGKPPFGSGNRALARILTEEPNLSAITEWAVIPVVRRALEKNTDDRYQTADEFKSDLRRVLDSLSETTHPVVPEPVARRFEPRRWLWIAPLLFVVALRHSAEFRTAPKLVVPPKAGAVTEPAPGPARLQNLALASIDFSNPTPTAILDAGSDETISLVLIRPGRFFMGQRRVNLSRPFYIGKFEVTEGQFDAVMSAKPDFLHLNQFPGKTQPVDRVTFEEAEEFCRLLSARTKVCVRLPTEAEWEYSCRGGTTSRFGAGDDETALARVAWYASNSSSVTHPAGTKLPNPWGLYDMNGNVQEWCRDWFADVNAARPESRAIDPVGPAAGAYRVSRGGSINSEAEECRCDYRGRALPGQRRHERGFRIVVSGSDCD